MWCFFVWFPVVRRFSSVELRHEADQFLPEGLELVWNGSHLLLRRDADVPESEELSQRYRCQEHPHPWCSLRNSSDSLRLRFSPIFEDILYEPLPKPMRVTPIQLIEIIDYLGLLPVRLLSDELGQDVYPHMYEYAVGEVVEASCGSGKIFWGGGWRPAVIEAVSPSTSPSKFTYVVRLIDGDASGFRVRLRFSQLRRAFAAVLSDDADTEDLGFWGRSDRQDPLGVEMMSHAAEFDVANARSQWLQFGTAVAIVTPTRLRVLQAYSPYFGNYWSLKGQEEESPDWRVISMQGLQAQRTLGLALSAWCDAPNSLQFRCSRATARRRTELFQQLFLAVSASSNKAGIEALVQACTFGIVCAMASFLAKFTGVFLSFSLVQLPAAYIVVNALRHVDVAAWPLRSMYMLGAYAVTPFLVVDEVIEGCSLLMDPLKTLLDDMTFECAARDAQNSSNSTLEAVEGLESLASRCSSAQLRFARDAMDQTKSALKWASGTYLWRLFGFTMWTFYLVSCERSRVRDSELEAAASRIRRAQEANANDVGADSEEPACRICLVGTELGALFSPCLCTGSMRYVHIDCLTRWRRTSVNTSNYYQCQSCMYRYSFHRTMLSSMLRSVLVLHIATLLAMVLLILALALIAQHCDRWFFGSRLMDYKSELSDLASEVLQLQTPLVDLQYLVASVSLVGLTGFLTLGLFYPPSSLGRRNEGAMILILLVGLLRSFFLIYEAIKSRSGRLLEGAERMVMDVGQTVQSQTRSLSKSVARSADPALAPAEGFGAASDADSATIGGSSSSLGLDCDSGGLRHRRGGLGALDES